jgi:hypothetical protein
MITEVDATLINAINQAIRDLPEDYWITLKISCGGGCCPG